MKQPIFVHPLTEEEHKQLEAGLRSPDASVLRRSQILLASSRGERVPSIALAFFCNQQTVRNAIHAFNRSGPSALCTGSHHPHRVHKVVEEIGVDAFKALLHRPPRECGYETSLWTLDLVAKEVLKLGWTSRLVSGEAIRQTLKKLGINWKRVKHWISSPDRLYFKKKRREIA